jgi:hypothetical protein
MHLRKHKIGSEESGKKKNIRHSYLNLKPVLFIGLLSANFIGPMS